MRVALVHERLTEIAGSEHVVAELARRWPHASVTIPIVDPRVDATFGPQVSTGALSSAYRTIGLGSYAPLLPLIPFWLRRREFPPADAVIISHHAFAIAAVHAAGSVPTIAYVHSPARWAWNKSLRIEEASSHAGRLSLDLLSQLAIWTERTAAPKITTVVANSTAVAQRIHEHWDRAAHVVHPPVNVDYFTPDAHAQREDFFLLPGRLVPYKRPDLAIRAAVAAGVKLVVAGDGRELARCRQLADGADVTFLGRVSNEELRNLYRRAKAMVMPGEEDFGITPVEAMACGTPVIALGAGGVLDSVLDGHTGTLVEAGDDAAVVDGFAAVFDAFRVDNFRTDTIRMHAENFAPTVFSQKMDEIVTQTAVAHRG